VALAPLSTRAAERLVRGALGAAADDALVAALVRRAAGHPFHLEELVRAVASGHGADALPDSVLGMVQARLDALGAQSRRILRAASVFGDSFYAGGVAALLGDDMPVGELRTILARLVEHEVVTKEGTPKSREEAQHRYRFRHALLREGAYAMLAEADRVRAHRRAASWLESMGESDPAVLADHYDRGGATEQALDWLRKAAVHALHRNDFDRAVTHASRARVLGPDGAMEGALRAVEAEVAYWRGDFSGAASHAAEAAARLAKTAPERFDAVAVAIGALGQLGRNEEVSTWLDEAARASSPPESRSAHVVALARGLTQLFWAHHGGGLAEVRAAIDALGGDSGDGDAFRTGWVRRVRGESAWLHARDVGRCLGELGASCAAFDRARAVRALCLTRMNAASLTGWSGAIEPARELLARSRAEAERLGAGFLLRYGRAVDGLVGAYGGDPGAEDAMRAALVDLQGSPRLAFICRIVIGSAALERGDVDAADAEARAAQAIAVVDDLRPAGIALASGVALARGDADLAVQLATEAERIESSRSDLELTYGIAAATLGEAHLARGDRDAARAVIGSIASKLDAIAATIEDRGRRALFWRRRLPNDRVARLAVELGVATATMA
jgi:tetratricopeptide (TPR) repeat protein